MSEQICPVAVKNWMAALIGEKESMPVSFLPFADRPETGLVSAQEPATHIHSSVVSPTSRAKS